jgi:uncharacterized protein (TIGR03000 family)
MKRSIFVGTSATCLALFVLVSSGNAQHGGGGHGGGGHGGGGHGGGGHSGGYGGHYGGYGGHYGGNGGHYSGYSGHHDGQHHDGQHHDDHHHNNFFGFGFFGFWPYWGYYSPYVYWYGPRYGYDGGYGAYNGDGAYDDEYYQPKDSQPSSVPAEDGNKARIMVIVPDSEARLWVENVLTAQKGTERLFISPPLEPGERYHYTIRATWKENGREVSKEQKVTVRSGYGTVLNLMEDKSAGQKNP